MVLNGMTGHPPRQVLAMMLLKKRSMLYGNDRQFLLYSVIYICWGVAVVFLCLNNEILHMVV